MACPPALSPPDWLVAEGGLDMPSPILATFWQDMSRGLDAFESCRYLVDTPFPFPWAQVSQERGARSSPGMQFLIITKNYLYFWGVGGRGGLLTSE
jgi:hypothetical protein